MVYNPYSVCNTLNHPFYSFSVELALASALVNFGWVTPGRLTPLIRPFMDTIRVTTVPTIATSITTVNRTPQPIGCDLDLPQPGENLRLQRLAAWNLARLLWGEFCQQASITSTSTVSSSKALTRVTQNLAKYIIPEEVSDWSGFAT